MKLILKDKQLAQFRKKELGFIFQDYSVLPTLTVKENIMLPLSVQKQVKMRWNKIIKKLLKHSVFMS